MLVGTLVTAFLLGAVDQRASPPPPYQEKQLLIFPAAYLLPIQTAFADFRKGHANWTCFRVVAVSRGGNLEINFNSPLVTHEDAQTRMITVGPQAKCGAAGASYLVTMDGKIIHRR